MEQRQPPLVKARTNELASVYVSKTEPSILSIELCRDWTLLVRTQTREFLGFPREAVELKEIDMLHEIGKRETVSSH